jgi:hypothetical protein
MAFVSHAWNSVATGLGLHASYRAPPPPPAPPNVNDAANEAQSQQDAMRARRGLLGNVYAGALSQQPVVGKTLLGT